MIGDLCELRVVFAHLGWRATCTLSFRSLTDDEAWREALAEEWATLSGPIWMLGLSEFVTVDHIQVDDVTPGGAAPFLTTPGAELRGGVPGDPVPHQVAALVHWFSDTPGRNSNGRLFLYGMPIDGIEDANYWKTASRAAMHAIADGTFSAYGPEGTSALARQVIISRWERKRRRDIPVSFDVTGLSVERMIATQRRRVYFVNTDE